MTTRTLAEVDADITAVEQRKIRPITELALDPRGEQGIGAPALARIKDYERQLVALRGERAAVVQSLYVPPLAPSALTTDPIPALTTDQISRLMTSDTPVLS